VDSKREKSPRLCEILIVKGKIKIRDNRDAQKYSNTEQLKRVLWNFVQLFFKCSPRVAFSWRSFLLRMFGAQIGHDVHIYNSVKIYFPWNIRIGNWSAIGENVYIYNLGEVVIGNKVTISHRTHICAGTHDYTDPTMPLIKPPINIGNQSWICTDAYIGPGVKIGEGAIVGARSVVTKDVNPWSVVGGNPAREIKKRSISK